MRKRHLAGKLLDAYKMSTDNVEFNFLNGSSLNIGNVRGLRRQSLIFEEVIEQNEKQINEVYIPLLNEPRKMANGLINPHEPQSQQVYITTAGYQGTFAYNKLTETLCLSILHPDRYFVLMGSYHIPVACHLTNPLQIEEVVNSPTFSRDSFEREYESVWSGAPEGAAFNANQIASARRLKILDFKDRRTLDQRENKNWFYVICADMAKDGNADTAVGVARVRPGKYYFEYDFVNMFTIPSTDYMVVANTFKKTILRYNARLLIYDANGVKLRRPLSTFQFIIGVKIVNLFLLTV